jgi:hypothetical protein
MTVDLASEASGCEGAACCRCDRCCEGEPWEIVGRATERLGLDVRAWMVAGFVANAHGNRTGNGNAPLGYNNLTGVKPTLDRCPEVG